MKVFCNDCIFFILGERIPFPFREPKCSDKETKDLVIDIAKVFI